MNEKRKYINEVKLKVWGKDERCLLDILNSIRDLYTRNCTVSRLIESDQGGFHAFVTIIYLGGENDAGRP